MTTKQKHVTIEQRVTPNWGTRSVPPKAIGVLHATAGSLEGDLAWIANPKSQVSYTAVIGPTPDPETDGEFAVIYQFLPWDGSHKAWAQLSANTDVKISLAMSSETMFKGGAWIKRRGHQLRTVALVIADQAQRLDLPIRPRHGIGILESGWLTHDDLHPDNPAAERLIPDQHIRAWFQHGQTHTDPSTDFKPAWKYILATAKRYIRDGKDLNV